MKLDLANHPNNAESPLRHQQMYQHADHRLEERFVVNGRRQHPLHVPVPEESNYVDDPAAAYVQAYFQSPRPIRYDMLPTPIHAGPITQAWAFRRIR